MVGTRRKVQVLFSILVVTAVVALLCSVGLIYHDLPRLLWLSEEELNTDRSKQYVKTHEGTTTEQDERYVTPHVIAVSHDPMEERRNGIANATSTVTTISNLSASLPVVGHSVECTNPPEVVYTPEASLPEMSSSPELVSPNVSPRSELGYMLTFSYSDQLTGGVLNLLSLMCLATKFSGVRVVEPLVVNSDLGVSGSMNWTEQLKFRDIYDISVLEKYVSTKHFNRFVSYETFIKNAPRKVLLVQYRYACGDQTVWNKAREFCDTNGFELVEKVCLTPSKEPFSVDSLRKHIYSKYKPSEVVVLFEIFGGIDPTSCAGGQPWRLCGRNTRCERGQFNMHMVTEPSPAVYSDADRYIQKYLNGSSKYISLMIRLEHVLSAVHKFNAVNGNKHARQCLTHVLRRWKNIKHRTGIRTTFLTLDVGRYGSKGYRRFPERERAIHSAVVQFFSAIYGNETSLEEWEDTFTTVGLGKTKTSGYIAMMQKVVAVKGNVLMLVGSKAGSAFLSTTKRMFHRLNRGGEVIELNNDCS